MECTRGSGRRRGRRHAAYALLFLVLSQAAGCGGDDDSPVNPLAPTPTTPTTPQADNRAPQAAGPIPAQALPAGGGAATMDVAPYFNDPDGDALAYTAASGDDGVVTAAVSGSTVALTPTGAGSATVTVTATDPGGLAAAQPVAVTVSSTGDPPPQGRPDLTVPQAAVAASPGGTFPGGSFTLSVTVRNDGDGASPATTLRYHQSADAAITTTDTEAGADPLAALAAGQSAGASADLTAPSTPGTYYYGACVDAVADEADTADNCSTAVEVEVLEPPARSRPNLVVAPPAASDESPAPGAAFTLSATVRNAGDGAAPATTLRYYQSTDAAISTADTAVGTDPVPALVASGSSSQSVDLTAPSTPGTYYYGACVDAVADEADTADNCSTAVEVEVLEPPARSRPNLVVAPPAASDESPAPGAAFTLSATVRNAGDGAAPATTLRYYQSTDAAISTADTAVGTDPVPALVASGSSSQSVDLTAPSTAGAYYYGACVDAVADEADTADNCSTAITVTVRTEPQTPAGEPDLVVMPPSVSDSAPAAGAAFSLSATVRNAGDGPAAATTLRYYRSTDAAVTTADTEEDTDAVAGLAAAGSGSESAQLTAPSTPGTYYYGACVDAVADEADTTNNCSTAVQVTVPAPPNLTVAAASVSDSSPAAGAAFTLSATVRNDGDGAAPATTLRWYRSTDDAISTADAAVGTGAVAGLAASASDAASVDLTAPATAGTYYYGACVDAVADEADTTDNCSTAVQVTVPDSPSPPRQTSPDLAVAAPTVSEGNPAPGAAFTLSVTVRNDGNGAAAATTLRWYRSADAAISTADTEEGAGAVTGLAASASANASVDLTAPSTPGTYYYGACVDAVAGESNTGNNCSTAAQVTVPQPPDLVVASASVSEANPAPGAAFTLSATVRNDGNGAAPATTLRWYRSADAAISTADTAAGTEPVAGLAAAGSASGSVDLTAPSTPGAYYYGACVDAVAGEADTANNCSAAVQVTVPQPPPQTAPDLVVGSPSVDDSSPAAGAAFTLSATVENEGDGDSPATTLRWYRSTDAAISTADTEEDTDAVEALAPAATSGESVDLTAPSTPGAYYYGACVDAVTDEADTTNNCSASVQVTVPRPPPDLVVGTPSVDDSSPIAGGTFNLSATVENEGDGDSPATTLRWYRSTDAAISTADTEEDTDAVEALAPSATSSETAGLTAPSTPGAYYYGACVDAVTDESDTTDNCSPSVAVDVEAAPPAPTSVEVTAADEWAPVGDTVRFSARVLDDEGYVMAGATVSWSSSNTGVATVDSNGLVTAVSAGTATISATAGSSASARPPRAAVANSSDDVSGSAEMEVVQRASRIELDPSSLTFDEVGDHATLTATVYDADDNEMRPTYWGWSSADREVATVSSLIPAGDLRASVQAIGEGTTTVRVNANGSATGSATVTVALPDARVVLSPASLTFDALGGTRSVTVRIEDEDGNEDEDATFSAVSGFSPCCGPDVAVPPQGIDVEIVDDGLEITAEGPGSGQITVSSDGVESAILLVTVYQNPSTLEVSPGSVSVAVDGTAALRAAVRDANGHSIHVNEGDGRGGLHVNWSTSDSAVATVDAGSGPATATVTGVAAGTATITGRHGSTITDTATVTVTN